MQPQHCDPKFGEQQFDDSMESSGKTRWGRKKPKTARLPLAWFTRSPTMWVALQIPPGQDAMATGKVPRSSWQSICPCRKAALALLTVENFHVFIHFSLNVMNVQQNLCHSPHSFVCRQCIQGLILWQRAQVVIRPWAGATSNCCAHWRLGTHGIMSHNCLSVSILLAIFLPTYSTQPIGVPNTVMPRGCHTSGAQVIDVVWLCLGSVPPSLAFHLNASELSQCIGEDVVHEANAPWMTHHVHVIQESAQLFACQELRGHFLQRSLSPNREKGASRDRLVPRIQGKKTCWEVKPFWSNPCC